MFMITNSYPIITYEYRIIIQSLTIRINDVDIPHLPPGEELEIPEAWWTQPQHGAAGHLRLWILTSIP